MATFQENLAEQALPVNPRRLSSRSSAVSAASDTSGAAQLATGVAQVASVGLQAFLAKEVIDKEEAGIVATKKGMDAAADIKMRAEQGLISPATKTYLLRQAETELIKGSTPREAASVLAGFRAATNTQADKQDETDFDVFVKLGKTVQTDPNETEEDQANRGAVMATLNAKLAADAVALETTIAQEERAEKFDLNSAHASALNVASLASPIIQASLHLFGNVRTQAELEQLMGPVTSELKAFMQNSMNTLNELMLKAGVRGPAQNSAREQLAAHLKPLENIFDSKNGVQGVQAMTDFLKAVTDNTQLDIIATAPMAFRLQTFLGPTGIGSLAASIVNGDTTVAEGLLGEIESIMRTRGTFSKENVNEVFSIQRFLLTHTDPEQAAELNTSQSARSAGVNLALDIVKRFNLDETSTETDIETFARQTAVGLVIGDKAHSPANRDALLNAYTSAGFKKNLDHIKKTNPDLAGRLERSISRYAASSIDKGLRRDVNKNIRFNPQEGQFVWEPPSVRFGAKTDSSSKAQEERDRRAGAKIALGEDVDEGRTAADNATILHLNKALLAIVENKSDKRLDKMSEAERVELVVQVTASIQNRQLLAHGTSYRTEGKPATADQKAAVSSILRPTTRDRQRDSIKSVFDRSADKLEDALGTAERSLKRMRIGADMKVIRTKGDD